jgi:hypothetical protein
MYANPEQFLIYQSEIDLSYYFLLKIGTIFSFERGLLEVLFYIMINSFFLAIINSGF